MDFKERLSSFHYSSIIICCCPVWCLMGQAVYYPVLFFKVDLAFDWLQDRDVNLIKR
jgi:hypothetical protein